MTIISASRQTAAPELTDVSELTLVVGHSAGVISFVNTAGAPQTDGCTTDQSLPSGLTIAVSASGDSCQISGTPDTPSAQTSYVISATNANGTGTASIAITVTAALLQPALPENGTSATFVESATIAALYIANTGGAVSTCQFVRPNDATYVGFLDGLSIDRAANGRDCEISGLLTGVGFKQFTVRAQNATGSDETPLNITVNPRAPAFAEPSAVVATDGQMIVPLSLTSTGGTLVSCQFIDPADDSETATFDGLNVAVSSSATACDITGTLTGTGLKSFKVRASNVTARVELTLSFTVNPAAPVLQAPSAQSYATGAAVSFDMTNTGGGQLSGNLDSPPGCAVDTPLPTGLSLAVSTDGNTCTISGTPETTQTASDYIITATNASASASATVSIAVVSGIASFAAPSPLTYIVGTDIGEQIFANTNPDAGRVTGCVASLLPTGLQIAAQDSPGNGCVLTGTPNTVTA
ncbi:MAG: hypothetical protein K8963_08810, partial [Proteobacteria bacterium]|nr:hypothetical protein [Pseudomonadota bacterium]